MFYLFETGIILPENQHLVIVENVFKCEIKEYVNECKWEFFECIFDIWLFLFVLEIIKWVVFIENHILVHKLFIVFLFYFMYFGILLLLLKVKNFIKATYCVATTEGNKFNWILGKGTTVPIAVPVPVPPVVPIWNEFDLKGVSTPKPNGYCLKGERELNFVAVVTAQQQQAVGYNGLKFGYVICFEWKGERESVGWGTALVPIPAQQQQAPVIIIVKFVCGYVCEEEERDCFDFGSAVTAQQTGYCGVCFNGIVFGLFDKGLLCPKQQRIGIEIGARVCAILQMIGNDNSNDLCGRPQGGLVATIIRNWYFAVLTAQTTDKEIGLIGGLCGFVFYPPIGDIVLSIVDNGCGIYDNGFKGNECEFGAVFTAIQQLERE